MSAKIHSPKWNMLVLALVILVGTLAFYFSDFASGPEGMARLVMVWIPLILGIGTAILYGISRLIGKRYNWIITLLGILLILYVSIPVFFGLVK